MVPKRQFFCFAEINSTCLDVVSAGIYIIPVKKFSAETPDTQSKSTGL
jgi:hypothetical protein